MALLGALAQPVTILPGVGPAAARRFTALGITTVGTLLEHFPRAHEDRSRVTPLTAVEPGRPVVVHAQVAAHHWFGPRGRHLRVLLTDAVAASPADRAVTEPDRARSAADAYPPPAGRRGCATLLCFGRRYLAHSLPPGRRITVAATFQRRGGELESAGFELFGGHDAANCGRIIPLYPLTEGIRPAMLRRTMLAACRYLDDLETPWDPCCRSHDLLPVAEAVRALHFPACAAQIEPARTAVAYAELLQLQTALRQRRPPLRRVRHFDGALLARVIARLPFPLTAGQDAALAEIVASLRSAVPSARLVQGDVGSGKTLVALLAVACAVEAGAQVAFVVPTELLARQHLRSARAILAGAGIGVALLTGAGAELPGGHAATRRELLADLRSGTIDVLVGTHALLQEAVDFARLGLVVIDEQHRFGVLQRRRLLQREPRADLLLMTATPIPRSLALTAYGDLERSIISELPPGRSPVRTHLVRLGNLEKVYTRVRTELASGGQVYVVAPRIAPREGGARDAGAPAPAPARPVPDAEAVYADLRSRVYPEFRVGLIHGAVHEARKHAVMESFRRGETAVLVATTVVEVGVDVANATGMVVLGAERFGLATLHQLRGRVGRGARPACAYLVYGEPLSDAGAERLRAMKESSDGFEIAERDLAQRGPGELLGLRQAGLPALRVADLTRDLDLALQARRDAQAARAPAAPDGTVAEEPTCA